MLAHAAIVRNAATGHTETIIRTGVGNDDRVILLDYDITTDQHAQQRFKFDPSAPEPPALGPLLTGSPDRDIIDATPLQDQIGGAGATTSSVERPATTRSTARAATMKLRAGPARTRCTAAMAGTGSRAATTTTSSMARTAGIFSSATPART